MNQTTKIVNFCPSKCMFKNIKMKDTDWGKHIAKHISDKELVFRICKQLLQLNNKMIT